MGLKDRFRIDELVKKGSAAIPRDKAGGIVVRRLQGKQIPPSLPPRDAEEFFRRKRKNIPTPIKKPIPFKPYGQEPITKKTVSPRYKHELPPIKDEDVLNINQNSFAGETSGFLEKPIYNEEELKKAVDVKVDELIKPKKQKRGDFIPKPRFDRLQERFDSGSLQIQDLSVKLANEQSIVQTQEGEINGLITQIDSLQAQVDAKQAELDTLLVRFNQLLEDYQNSVIRGTKEGIERVSLTAQVRGLQAQKETLQAQLTAQQDIVQSLQQQAEIQQQVTEAQAEAAEERLEQAKKTNLLDIVGDRPQYEVKGNIAWASKASNKNIKPQWPVYWDDRKKNPKGILSGMVFDFFNIGDESVTLNVTEEVLKTGKWLTGVPRSLTIPKSPDAGSTPGQKTITLGRGSTGKGTYETLIKFKNPNTGEELKIKTHYWQARSRRKT